MAKNTKLSQAEKAKEASDAKHVVARTRRRVTTIQLRTPLKRDWH